MGAPGKTVFCRNGHIVEEVPHHCISQYDEFPWSDPDGLEVRKRPPCVCGCQEFIEELEWGDPDYRSSIPTTPIGFDKILSQTPVEVQLENGKIVMAKPILSVPKFDLSSKLVGTN